MHIARRLLGVGAVSIMSMTAFVTTAAAEPSDVFANGATVADVRAFFEEHDVPTKTQDILIDELRSGAILDADNGSKPVSSEVEQEGSFQVTTYTYADGSISVSKIERPYLSITGSEAPAITPMSNVIGKCRYTRSGTGYVAHYDCLAYHESTGLGVGMRVDYTISQGYDSIGKVHAGSGYKYSITRTADEPTLRLVRRTETSSSRASATASGYWRSANGAQSGMYRMTFSVGKNNPSTSLTF